MLDEMGYYSYEENDESVQTTRKPG